MSPMPNRVAVPVVAAALLAAVVFGCREPEAPIEPSILNVDSSGVVYEHHAPEPMRLP